jgi:hypothetical protein
MTARGFALGVVGLAIALGPIGCGDGSDGASSPHARLAGHRVLGTHGDSPQGAWSGPSDDYHPTGPLTADDGFRPQKDGFSFANYDGESGAANLTPAAMEELFGPDVCSTGVGSSCLLSPVAAQNLEQLNSELQGGHCYGFSVAALRFFTHVLSPSTFGATTVPALNIDGNDLLQTEIAEAFISQTFPSVRSAVVRGKPSRILRTLTKSLRARRDVYTIGFYMRDGSGGHAITPYAVEDRGNGRFAILVYDNNHPMKTRAMAIDPRAETWTYDAADGPRAAEARYEGDARTRSIELHPMKPGLGPQPCPFCGASNASGGRGAKGSGRPSKPQQQIALAGDPSNHGHLLITDPQGRRTGYVGRRLVTEIPGSHARFPLADQNWRLHPEPVYTLPADVKVTVTASGGSLARPAVENVSVVKPGASAAVNGLRVGPGQQAQLGFGRSLASVKYRAGDLRGAAPIVKLGRDTAGPDFAVSLKAPVLEGPRALSVRLDPAKGRVTVKSPEGAPAAGYALSLSRFTALGKQEFRHGGLSLAPGSSARLRFRGFDRSGQALPFSTNAGGGWHSTTLSG